MSLGNSFSETLRLRYSYVRFRWLAIAVAGMAIMTFSAQELWGGNAQGLWYTVNAEFFYLYAAFFVAIIWLANFIDYRKVCERTVIAVCCTFTSIIIDLSVLFTSELLILLTINQLPIELIKSITCIFLIVFPWSLGELTLSSLTVEYLKKRAEKLQKEAEELRKEAEHLEEGRKKGEKDLKEFERKKAEFKKALESKKDSGEKS
jgi:hypothetical protein